MTKPVIRIAGLIQALVSLVVFLVDMADISPAETALCVLVFIAGAAAALLAGKLAPKREEPPKPEALAEENERLKISLAQSNASLEGLREYIAELIPQESGSFRESFVLMGIVFTPKQFMDKVNELTERELAERGLDFSVDISPSLPEKLCGDMPRLALSVCGMISAAAARTESGRISLEILAAGGERIELRVSDTGSQLPREALEASLLGRFADEYIYSARTAEIMHGGLKLRNTRTGASASLTVLLNPAETNVGKLQTP